MKPVSIIQKSDKLSGGAKCANGKTAYDRGAKCANGKTAYDFSFDLIPESGKVNGPHDLCSEP